MTPEPSSYHQRHQRTSILLGFLFGFTPSAGLPATLTILITIPLMLTITIHISKIFWQDRSLISSFPRLMLGFLIGTITGNTLRILLT